ncbi:MAG: hypothetical protein AABO57_03535 [Acidobacteriota bacterium]
MDTQILIALVTSGSALLVAITTGILQFLQSRSYSRQQKSLTRDGRAWDIAIEQWREKQKAIRESSKAIQSFQDEMLLLIRSAPKSLLAAERRERVQHAQDAVITAYREHHSVFDNDERRRFQVAKEKAIEISLFLDMTGVWDGQWLEIGDREATEIDRALSVISQSQHELLLSALNEFSSLALPRLG